MLVWEGKLSMSQSHGKGSHGMVARNSPAATN